MENVIIAPHPDDEIIGNYEILEDRKNITVMYSNVLDMKRKEEAERLKLYFPNINLHFSHHGTYENIHISDPNKEKTYYFPDPIYEIHPDHRRLGAIGEILLRKGYNVIFYSVNMNAPYIHEVKSASIKEKLLNEIYPSQKSLWEFEKKFILFEGRVKWLM